MKLPLPHWFVRERYASLGVDTDRALQRLAAVALSLHCWQGDDDYHVIAQLEKPVSVIGLGTASRAFTPNTYDRAAELLNRFRESQQ